MNVLSWKINEVVIEFKNKRCLAFWRWEAKEGILE